MKINAGEDSENLPALLEKILEEEYRISVSGMERLNIGFDQNTAVYKVFPKEGKEYFVKLRYSVFNESSLAIPLWIINNTNTKNIIDIVKTRGGKLYVKKSRLYFFVYPFVEGQSGWKKPLTKNQFIDFGKFMSRLHSLELPDKYKKLLPVEQFDSKYRKGLKKYLNGLGEKNCENRLTIEFFETLKKKKDVIHEIINIAEASAKQAKQNPGKLCLCHGDIHAGNVLIGETGFYVIDWDTIILSPKEKDLMFIGAGIGGKWNSERERGLFYSGYGERANVNTELIKYYRHERIVQDIYEFFQQIVDPLTDDTTRKSCLKHFNGQFEPNNVVDIALKTG